jgi:septal ring factor EnvC (AmiA/AmiB activator)
MPRGRLLAIAAALALAAPLQARQDPDTALANSQERLSEIRRERERLQREMERLRGRVHSLSSELSNIERQVQISGRMISELDLQVTAMGSEIERITRDLLIAEDGLTEKRAILQHRLVEISKRGPLFAAQVLLAAESFGDLISRYKYLYLITRQDRQLVRDVQQLRDQVRAERDRLISMRGTLARRRDERAEETERLRELERQREESLRLSQRQQRDFERRLQQLARDEERLTTFIRDLERRRRADEAASRRPAPPSRLTTAALGRLDWPVEGDIVYSFGRAPGPGNTTIRWNGIGIATPVGTSVRAIEGGTVRYSQQFGTYGLSVLVDHGGGYYSMYGHLQTSNVRPGQEVTRGTVIGTSGGDNTDQGPHVHFEIRGSDGQAQDPVQWLRQRGR